MSGSTVLVDSVTGQPYKPLQAGDTVIAIQNQLPVPVQLIPVNPDLVFHSILMNAGPDVDTTVWTPTAQKKFALLGWMIAPAALTMTGNCYCNFKDQATSMGGAAAWSSDGKSGPTVVNLPFPRISAATGNLLRVNVDGTFTTGFLMVLVWGYEI
jgi:hypothetical protein